MVTTRPRRTARLALAAALIVLVAPVLTLVAIAGPAAADESDISVTTYNVKNNFYRDAAGVRRHYPAGDPLSWPSRLPAVAATLATEHVPADVIALQEATPYDDVVPTLQLRDRLNAAQSERSFAALTVGTASKSLLYDTRALTASTPRAVTATVSYDDGGTPRTKTTTPAVYSLLTRRSDGARFVAVSVHLLARVPGYEATDGKSEHYRGKEMRVVTAAVRAHAAEQGLGDQPRIVYLGDFNTYPGRSFDGAADALNAASAYETGRRIESRLACGTPERCVNLSYNSYNAFEPPKQGIVRMDRVFVTTTVGQVVKYKLFKDLSYRASDHFPVKTWLQLVR